MESGGAVALLRVWMAQISLGAFWGVKSLLHLLSLLLKSHIHRFEAMVLVTSTLILPFWKAPWQGHTRGVPTGIAAQRGGSSIPGACSSPSLPGKLRASISLLIALIRECGGVNWKTLGSRLFAGGMDVNKPGLMSGMARVPRRLAASRGMSRKCYCSDEAIVN